MQATPRGRSPYAFAFANQVFPPAPPPPKPMSWKGVPTVEGANRASTITSATTKVRPIEISTIEADPKWLEDEVVRLIKKHGLEALPEVRKIALEQLRNAQPADADMDFVAPAPSRLARIGRTARTSLLVALLVVSAGLLARWRYPVQTEAFVAKGRTAIARVTPPPSWSHALMRVLDPRASRAMVAPEAPLAPEAAPAFTPPVAAADPASAAPAPVTPPTTLAAEPPPPPSTESAPVVAAPEAPASVSASEPSVAIEPKHVSAPAVHHAVATPVAPKPAAAPAPAPVVTAAAPKEPAPAPGSLAEAIQRAGTRGAGKVPTIGEHAISADPKVVAAASLPERPSASVVTSALLSVLPDARACLNDGDDARQASVVFDGSGAVSGVQVSGAGASCVQKALSHAHVAPFSQPTYRATITVRPN